MGVVSAGKEESLVKLTGIASWLVVLLAVCAAPGALDPKDEADAFVKEVIKDARSDSQKSSLLIKAAAAADGNDALKIVLLENALQYGVKGAKTSTNCKTLLAATAILAKIDPTRRHQWLSQRAAIYRRWSLLTKSSAEKRQLLQASADALFGAGRHSGSAGDWKYAVAVYKQGKSTCLVGKLPDLTKMSALLRTATYLQLNQTKIDDLVETLKKSPDDIEARSDLIKKLVTVMDDPKEATKHLNEDVDQLFRTFVPMATKEVSELSSDSCKALGDWYYKELSKSSVGIAKSRMLTRAGIYYSRALELQDKSDLASAELKMNLSRIKTARESVSGLDPLLCAHCLATGKMKCRTCQGSGMDQCRYCRGAGRVKCERCGGAWRTRCSRCGGKGKTVSGHKTRGGLIYKSYSKCSKCGGKGVTHRSRSSSYTRPGPCPTCSGAKESLRGTSACRRCRGKGASGTCKICRGAKTVRCVHCGSK